MYASDNLTGGHIIMLGTGNEEASRRALSAFPGGMQIGGELCLGFEAGIEVFRSVTQSRSRGIEADHFRITPLSLHPFFSVIFCTQVVSLPQTLAHTWMLEHPMLL
jgi:hypothetical protein